MNRQDQLNLEFSTMKISDSSDSSQNVDPEPRRNTRKLFTLPKSLLEKILFSSEFSAQLQRQNAMENVEMFNDLRDWLCKFCLNNGEDDTKFLSHRLKDDRGRITCPVLYNYVCPICGATGPWAHTIRYCPESRENKNRIPVRNTRM